MVVDEFPELNIATIILNILVWVQQNKDIYTGVNNPRVRKWRQNCHLWVNYVFKRLNGQVYPLLDYGNIC